MRIFEHSKADAESSLCPFRNAFHDDLWVLYHGTSNHAESAIERTGFCWNDETYSHDEIESLLGIFDSLRWTGTDGGGVALLASFTKSDFEGGASTGRKPTFFAEGSHRALLYAQSDWTGGETARAIRRAFADLSRFSESAEIRRDALLDAWRSLRGWFAGEVPHDCRPASDADLTFVHLHRLWRFCEAQGFRPGIGVRPGVEPAEFSEEWLRVQLDRVRPLRERSENLVTTFRYGVVYAVRFEPADIRRLRYSPSAGLAACGAIPPERILAKAIVDPAAVYRRGPRAGTTWDPDSEARCRAIEGNGVVARVLQRDATALNADPVRHETTNG